MTISLRSYDPAACAVFRTTKGAFGIFSNFHPGYPISLRLADGRKVNLDSTETLYQADKFRDRPDLQQGCIDAAWAHASHPRGGKDFARAHDRFVSADWKAGRSIASMRHAIRLKLCQHRDEVIGELEKTDGRPIVELSTRDEFWGAKPQPDGTLKGMNILGRLFMEMRAALETDPDFCRYTVEPPPGATFLGVEIAPWVRPARILNAHACGTEVEGAVYVGRLPGGKPSPWANPHRVSEEMPRGQAVLAFARDLAADPGLVAAVRAELAGRDLICWCAPRPCHAEILRHVAEGNEVPEDPQAFLDSLHRETSRGAAAPQPEAQGGFDF